jgi:hypothetical protein
MPCAHLLLLIKDQSITTTCMRMVAKKTCKERLRSLRIGGGELRRMVVNVEKDFLGPRPPVRWYRGEGALVAEVNEDLKGRPISGLFCASMLRVILVFMSLRGAQATKQSKAEFASPAARNDPCWIALSLLLLEWLILCHRERSEAIHIPGRGLPRLARLGSQ